MLEKFCVVFNALLNELASVVVIVLVLVVVFWVLLEDDEPIRLLVWLRLRLAKQHRVVCVGVVQRQNVDINCIANNR